MEWKERDRKSGREERERDIPALLFSVALLCYEAMASLQLYNLLL